MWHVSSRSSDGRLACKLLYPSLLFTLLYYCSKAISVRLSIILFQLPLPVRMIYFAVDVSSLPESVEYVVIMSY